MNYTTPMKDRTYWKNYVHQANADEIVRSIKLGSFFSEGENLELLYFENSKNAPNVLIAPGSGAHAYVYAELGYFIYLKGYNFFIFFSSRRRHTR